MFVYIYIYIYVRVYIYIYIYTYIYMYMYICIYAYIYIQHFWWPMSVECRSFILECLSFILAGIVTTPVLFSSHFHSSLFIPPSAHIFPYPSFSPFLSLCDSPLHLARFATLPHSPSTFLCIPALVYPSFLISPSLSFFV